MVLAFPDDPGAVDERFQYMFGQDFFVAPIYQGTTRRVLHLPRGTWTVFWTGERVEGGQEIEVDVPLARMPVFVRDGAVIITLPEDIDTLVHRTPEMDASVVALDERRIIEVWPGGAGAAGECAEPGGIRARVMTEGPEHRLVLENLPDVGAEVRLRFTTADVRLIAGDLPMLLTAPIGADTVVSIPGGSANVTIAWDVAPRPSP